MNINTSKPDRDFTRKFTRFKYENKLTNRQLAKVFEISRTTLQKRILDDKWCEKEIEKFSKIIKEYKK